MSETAPKCSDAVEREDAPSRWYKPFSLSTDLTRLTISPYSSCCTRTISPLVTSPGLGRAQSKKSPFFRIGAMLGPWIRMTRQRSIAQIKRRSFARSPSKPCFKTEAFLRALGKQRRGLVDTGRFSVWLGCLCWPKRSLRICSQLPPRRGLFRGLQTVCRRFQQA